MIRLAVGTSILTANITPWAADELNLHVGDNLYAQIKGVSLSQQDLA
ncbi:TOBE domain-containing protein [Photobacterium sp. R1]